MLGKLDSWRHTRPGLTATGLIQLALAYGFASWAIDSGSLWLYAATLIVLIGGLQNLAALLASFVPRRHQ